MSFLSSCVMMQAKLIITILSQKWLERIISKNFKVIRMPMSGIECRNLCKNEKCGIKLFSKTNSFYLVVEDRSSNKAHIVTVAFDQRNKSWKASSIYVTANDLNTHIEKLEKDNYCIIGDDPLSLEETLYVTAQVERDVNLRTRPGISSISTCCDGRYTAVQSYDECHEKKVKCFASKSQDLTDYLNILQQAGHKRI